MDILKGFYMGRLIDVILDFRDWIKCLFCDHDWFFQLISDDSNIVRSCHEVVNLFICRKCQAVRLFVKQVPTANSRYADLPKTDEKDNKF